MGLLLWQVIQYVDNGHHKPANGASPEMWGAACNWIRPFLLPAFVPGMIEQARSRVACAFLDQNELAGNVIEEGWFIEAARVLRQEWTCHIYTIQPYLMGIDLFMPESAAACTRLFLQLLAQQPQRLTIPFLAC